MATYSPFECLNIEIKKSFIGRQVNFQSACFRKMVMMLLGVFT